MIFYCLCWGGSLKSVAIVPKEFDGEVATNGFVILRTGDENLRYFVFYYLITRFAQMQIERNLTGAIMSTISISDLGNILIPHVDQKSQEKIRKKIKEVNAQIITLQGKAEKVIKVAKEKVEKMTLGSEDD